MSVLEHFPMQSQLADTQEANREFDCVPTCVSASLTFLLGKPYDAGTIKDEVYGKDYTGPTDAANYVTYCARQGVKLAPFTGIPGALVSQIHAELAAEHPCIVTIPDPWAPSSTGWTHVLVAFEDSTNTITMLDPYPGKPYVKSDSEWMELLLNNQIWILSLSGKEEDFMPIDITTPGVADQFQQLDATHWRSKQTGKIVGDAILAEFQRIGFYAGWGHPLSNEVYYNPNECKQNWTCVVAGYSKATGKVSLLPLYAPGSAGIDPAIAQLEKELAAAKAAPVQNAQALTVVKQIQQLVKPF